MNASNQKHDSSAPSMGLTSFDHVTLIVKSVERSRHFYVNLMGMVDATRPDFDFPGAWFQLGGTMIHVTQESDLAGLAGWGDRAVKSISRGHHVAYLTKDFDQALATLEIYQIPIADGPKVRPDGARQVYIYDPDRHVIEICEPAPVSS